MNTPTYKNKKEFINHLLPLVKERDPEAYYTAKERGLIKKIMDKLWQDHLKESLANKK